jgi:outer membrane lipoprotein LolB
MTPLRALGLSWLLMLGACANLKPSAPTSPAQTAAAVETSWSRHWQGRLSLNVKQTPSQTVFAGFELDGDEHRGEMRILGPLGSTALLLQWQPGQATVSDGQSSRSSPDLQQLMQQLTGVDLPIGLIFDGLHGRPVQASGWWIEAPAGQGGRLYAVRLDPLPRIELLLTWQNTQP